MSQSLSVIALISGGKDSIYSILHCLQNGHKVVALGNVHPLPQDSNKSDESPGMQEVEADEENLNSYMYQTVGYTVIPLYEHALGIPLYREPIMGNASATEATYEKPANGMDETESLVPLLRRIMVMHPEANAVSTGAILSTYQRTRVESVALRLGLVPLSFLWQYPSLLPTSKISLLADMAAVGLDARIIKTASWALNESFLWQNVASKEVMQKIEKGMARFGNEDGAALGEGGEFETLALDGPDHLFKGRIVVEEEDRQIIQGSAVTAWVRIHRARVEMKIYNEKSHNLPVRKPDLLSDGFQEVCQAVDLFAESGKISPVEQKRTDKCSQLYTSRVSIKSTAEGHRWTMVGLMQPDGTIENEVEYLMAQIKESLDKRGLDVGDVIFTLILLRSMSHFALVNKIYGSLFTKPNPPARVTIACGDLLPPGYNIVVQLSISSQQGDRRSIDDLHVQSRSYWAPANIGPYSQARSDVIYHNTDITGLVYVAGQIPLIPSTMTLPEVGVRPSVQVNIMNNLADPYLESRPHQFSSFIGQAVLSLQHLWRIGQAIDICWCTGAVAYLSRDTSSNISQKARLAAEAWLRVNGGQWQENSCPKGSERSNGDERDPWDERYHKALLHREATTKPIKVLPDWSMVNTEHLTPGKSNAFPPKELPPFFAAEVEELPRGSAIEWHALLGITNGPITQTHSSKLQTSRAIKHTIAHNTFSQTIVSITYAEHIPDLAALIEALLSEMDISTKSDDNGDGDEDKDKHEYEHEYEHEHDAPLLPLPRPGSYHGCHTAYLDASVEGLWSASAEQESFAGVVPCRSLWGAMAIYGGGDDNDDDNDRGEDEEKEKRGVVVERLAAVLVFQSLLGPGERSRSRSWGRGRGRGRGRG